ncbi:hypothetical protein F2P81_012484 [Scophthalmus maximus]|uniref:Uncharacterized protein n=1 Tax=Scophthalmus maximus TaxID=52904 RepID=A0A6A4SHU0_SCOMX|nr:hypothetical protein F2P81_012484 [Scophthalmus maximus]
MHHICSSRRRPPGVTGSVVQREEDVRVLSDAVVGEALQVDQQVVRYRNSARFPVSLPRPVALETDDRHADDLSHSVI